MLQYEWAGIIQQPKLPGDIERDLASAQIDYNGALSEFIMEMTEEVMGMVCGIIPDESWLQDCFLKSWSRSGSHRFFVSYMVHRQCVRCPTCLMDLQAVFSLLLSCTCGGLKPSTLGSERWNCLTILQS